MDVNGVDEVSEGDITTDGMCKAYRPEGMKNNKKWKPDCSVTLTAAMCPFKKHKDYSWRFRLCFSVLQFSM